MTNKFEVKPLLTYIQIYLKHCMRFSIDYNLIPYVYSSYQMIDLYTIYMTKEMRLDFLYIKISKAAKFKNTFHYFCLFTIIFCLTMFIKYDYTSILARLV